MNKQCQHYDIVIVGAGLVGASLASLLAMSLPKDSVRIAVVDGGREVEPTDITVVPPVFDPRVVALTSTSIQLLESLGVWQTLQQQRVCAYQKMHVWDNDGTASISFDAEEIQQQNLGCIVENSLVLRAVLDTLKQYSNVTTLQGVAVEALSKYQDKTLLTLADGQQLSATLLVAADGARSKIRTLANIPVREWEYHQKAIVATVKSEQAHQHTAWQNFLTSGPLAFLPLCDNSVDISEQHYCSIVWSVDSACADDLMALDDNEFCRRLEQAFQYRLGRVESISQRFCFPLQQRHAIDYIQPGIALMGDAAHSIHPLAGQGVNLGLLDVLAMRDELVRAVDKNLALNEASVLRRYQRQRKTNNLEVMLLMEGFKRLFGEKHLLVRCLRNMGMKKANALTPLKNWLAKQAIGVDR